MSSGYVPGTGPAPSSSPGKSIRKDEYDGQYKDQSKNMSPDQKWGLSQNPVKEPQAPWKGLRSIGG